MRRAVVGLAIETLVLEEKHRVVAAYRRAQQTAGVESVRRHHHAEPGNVRELHLPALAVINSAAIQVAADGHAQDHGARESAVRAPANGGQLIADLHHRGPDVIEELYFRNGFQTARRHADGAAHDGGFSQRSIEGAAGAELHLQPGGDLEHSAFAFDVVEIFLARAIGHVLAEDQDVGIAPHLFAQSGVDQIHHGLGFAGEMRRRCKFVRCRIDAFRVQMLQHRLR